ncbi:type I-E CRISPR-associated protein Cas6/Cse3/CasE [Bifidobacterium psychraerophilum]|uniref:type I-E CRISPR-associated protein Cas6/Cse3/CasE n=1 Tax=Bifidobacterium psychraerophilum TaxID=218140 RepID=UPI0039E9761F
MTEFTRIIIDPRHRSARYALTSLERLHAIVARSVSEEDYENSTPPSEQSPSISVGNNRALWRIDHDRSGQSVKLYIVSETHPRDDILLSELGVEVQDCSSCGYESFLSRLDCGQEWGFRLKANPTKSLPSGVAGQRGKRCGISNKDEQLEWLWKQGRAHGFHMPINRLEVPEVVIRESGSVNFSRRQSTVTLMSTVYEGVLAVDDPTLLREALVSGIGRAKGYGFGLMTLLPLIGRNYSRSKP